LLEFGSKVEITDGQAITTSVEIARVFEKRHTHVLDSIKTLAQQLPESNQPNFRLVDYTDDKGERRPAYHLTRDGFTLLAFGFTGKKAMAFKLAYIDAFNRMEAALAEQAGHLPAPAQPERPMNDTLTDTGITPDMIADIVASTTNTLVATLQQKRKLIHWPDIIEAVQNPQTDMAFPDLTALLQASIARFTRSIDSEAYRAIERRAAQQGVSTRQVPLNA